MSCQARLLAVEGDVGRTNRLDDQGGVNREQAGSAHSTFGPVFEVV